MSQLIGNNYVVLLFIRGKFKKEKWFWGDKLNIKDKYIKKVMASGNSGFFTPKNVNKLIPKRFPLKYKSSWELYFMNFLDKNPNIINWGYEIIKIPYFNPFKKKTCHYYPDFFVKYIDRNNKINYEMIEIKPSTEFIKESAKTRTQKLFCVLNEHKWNAAKKWCEKRNLNFRIISEKDIFI